MNNPGSPSNNARHLYTLVRDILPKINSAVAMSFLSDLPSVQELEKRTFTPSVLSVVSVLEDLGPTTLETKVLVTAVIQSATAQAWRQPYAVEDFGADFAERSGWFAIADREGPLVMTTGLVEIMLLDAHLSYPMHSHTPEELYVVLAGEVWWEAEGDPDAPAWRRAGNFIHHPSHRRHALTAGEKPAMLLALWRGGSFEKPVIT